MHDDIIIPANRLEPQSNAKTDLHKPRKEKNTLIFFGAKKDRESCLSIKSVKSLFSRFCGVSGCSSPSQSQSST